MSIYFGVYDPRTKFLDTESLQKWQSEAQEYLDQWYAEDPNVILAMVDIKIVDVYRKPHPAEPLPPDEPDDIEALLF